MYTHLAVMYELIMLFVIGNNMYLHYTLDHALVYFAFMIKVVDG